MSAQLNNNNSPLPLTSTQIAAITGSPVENVRLYWPLIVNELERETIDDRFVQIAVLATIAVEDPVFKPIDERGTLEYFTKMYEHRKDLGNVFPGDGARYHGRGFIQLTGRTNYYTFSALTGSDLMQDPDLALNPVMSARILAVYFKTHHIAEAARSQDWKKVRFLVNGGLTDFGRFILIVQRLLAAS
ncbi:MAG TPA: hypothetical protein V6C69_01625 [Trichormus sp.]|jgi:hypothetical protein